MRNKNLQIPISDEIRTNQNTYIEEKHITELKPILSLKEVMDLLSVSRRTLDNWHNEKILLKNWIGTRVYYNTSDIYTYFQSKSA